MIDACWTHSNVLNSGLTGPNNIKFLNDAEESLPFNSLKSESRSSNPFQNASLPNEYGVGHGRIKVGAINDAASGPFLK